MAGEQKRDLTNLEYIVLGFIAIQPQSGYSILNYLENNPRWSASPGSVYPMLKRLEAQGVIDGEIDAVHETRPRKMYTLSPTGAALLDDWIRTPPKPFSMVEERYVTFQKFLYHQFRLPVEETLAWLDECDRVLDEYQQINTSWTHMVESEMSIYQQLVSEAAIMELHTLRMWVQMARGRLQSAVRRTGEFRAARE